MAWMEPKAGQKQIRDPRDPKMDKGQIANPPRYMKLGGLEGPGKVKKGAFAVAKPGEGR